MTTNINPSRLGPPRVLATDLDGTLIPLPDNPGNVDALAELRRWRDRLSFAWIFATGRHFESVLDAIRGYDLPSPDWIVCDVGAAVYRRLDGDDGFAPFGDYARHLRDVTRGVDRSAVEHLLAGIDGLEPQPPEHQQPFKISYESAGEAVSELVSEINERIACAALPYACTGSLDPFAHCGLLDVLPQGVSKAYALHWLTDHAHFRPEDVVFAGDSGNDLPALTGGFRAVIVANASPGLRHQAEAVLHEHGGDGRLYAAEGSATTGVLEGCRFFGLIPA